MPHATEEEAQFQLIEVTQLHPTFGAEVRGVDFSKPVAEDVFAEIHDAITKYGVLVFRSAALDDTHHVAFAARFGALDDIKPYLALGRTNRLPYDELFDVSNLNDDGSIAQPGTRRDWLGRGNTRFHVDSSFNPRRAGFSLLRAYTLPPHGMGGNTEFADCRAAYAQLAPEVREQLRERDYVAAHSLWHSRKLAAPGFEEFKTIEPRDYPFGRHRLVQRHEASGRMNLYVASHVHHLEQLGGDGTLVEVDEGEGRALIDELMAHATRRENVLSVEWMEDGDLVVWDNTCVMHRAAGGSYEGKYIRDMRRCTVHDGSVHAWGFNEKNGPRMGLP